MIDVDKTLGALISSVKAGDFMTAREHLIVLFNERPQLNSHWLGVARMALLSGEVSHARTALKLYRPSNPSELAEQIQHMAMFIEAGDMYSAEKKAYKLYKKTNNRPEVAHFLSTISLQLGKVDLAIKYAEQTIKQWPFSGEAWLLIASAKRFRPDSEMGQRMLNEEQNVLSKNNPISTSSYYAALSKMFFYGKEHKKAFECARKSNEYMSKTKRFDLGREEQCIDRIAHSYSNVNYKNESVVAANSDNPIFIVGLPRTGTTLLEQILCSNSRVIDGGEFNGMERASRCLTKGSAIGNHPEHFDSSLVEKCSSTIRQDYLSYAQQRFGKEGAIVDKSLNNNRYLWLIKKVFPESPIIFINRNAQDAAWSCYRTLFSNGLGWSHSLENIAQHFAMENKLSSIWLKEFSESILSISYEEMVTNPTMTIQTICHFCKLEYEKGMLNFYDKKRAVLTASVSQVRESLNTDSINSARDVAELMNVFDKHYQGSF